jgi:hypothetical protein
MGVSNPVNLEENLLLSKLKYMGTTLINNSYILKETEVRLDCENAYFHYFHSQSVQDISSSRVISKNVYPKCNCTCTRVKLNSKLRLREEHRLSVLEKRVMWKILETSRREVTERCRKFGNKELHNLYSSPNFIRMIKSRRMRWRGM